MYFRGDNSNSNDRGLFDAGTPKPVDLEFIPGLDKAPGEVMEDLIHAKMMCGSGIKPPSHPQPPTGEEVLQQFAQMFGKITLEQDTYNVYSKEPIGMNASGIILTTTKFKTNLTKIDTGFPSICCI